MAADVVYRIDGVALKWRIGLMDARVSVLSDEPIVAYVRADHNGMVYDPRGAAVSMAFTSGYANPAPGDFKTGVWDVTSTGQYTALVKCGATGANLAVGEYYVWVKIVDGSAAEAPIRQVGKVIVQ